MPEESLATTKTPTEWASELHPAQRDRWKHEVADQHHGWSAHAHHQAKEMQLTRADYEAAVASACNGQEPIPAALSPHAPVAIAAALEAAKSKAAEGPGDAS